MKNLVWGLVVDSPCPGEGFNNFFPLHGKGWKSSQVLPHATPPLEGAGEGKGPATPWHGVELLLGCKSCIIESLAAPYLPEIQSCPAYPWVCARAMPLAHAVAEQTRWVVQ